MVKITAQVLTYNEEKNLPRCLESLDWCDEIVVIDSGSTDNTIEIAERYGCTVLVRPFDDFANQRNFGIDSKPLEEDWILHFDADEVVTPELRAKLVEFVPEPNIWAYNLPSKLMMNGQWLRFSGSYPVYQVRFGRRDKLRFIQYGHGQREDLPQAEVSKMDEPYLHFNFSHGLTRWFTKHVRYAHDEAEQIKGNMSTVEDIDDGQSTSSKRRRLKTMAGKIPPVLRPFMRFVWTYLVKSGWRDGRAGLQYALMLSAYEAMTSVYLMQDDHSQA